MFRRVAIGVCAILALAGCREKPRSETLGSSTKKAARARHEPTVYAPLASASTTRERTIVPRHARTRGDAGANPADPNALGDYLERGFGALDQRPGDPYVTRVLDGPTKPPPPGSNARSLVRFAHLADLQIADDESPTRAGQYDGIGATSAALRPHDPYLCHMANAAVRTINALHARAPLSFTLLGGDNADSAQSNEIDWVLGILSGSDVVECDSGEDDDLVPGPSNDGKDPFRAEGLRMPWKWVTGNHDILVQGNFVVRDYAEEVVGRRAGSGTRRYDGAFRGAIDRGDFVVPDPKRAVLTGPELMAKVGGHGDGHGIGHAERASGRATYTFDVDGAPLRVLVIDTAHPNGGSEGVITRSEVERVIKPALDRAKAEGKWVILAAHHAVSNLGDGTAHGGLAAPDALSPAQWTALLGRYDNVLFSMVGHSHRHRVAAIRPARGHAFWEIMTASLADYPHQFRLIDVLDQDNGWLMLRATAVDFSFEDDPIAAEGKKRGVVDFTSGWLPAEDVSASDKNVEVWIKRP